MKTFLSLISVVIFGILTAFALAPSQAYQCITDSPNSWKNESGGSYTAPAGKVIESVWVKAGQGCFELPYACYEITSGGVGYSFVEVVNTGEEGCQDLSHLEGTFRGEDPTDTPTPEDPTNTPTPEDPTPTDTVTPEDPTPTDTVTPEVPTETPTPEVPTDTPTPNATFTPYHNNGCTNPDGCGGKG
jgi:hypothetical protein